MLPPRSYPSCDGQGARRCPRPSWKPDRQPPPLEWGMPHAVGKQRVQADDASRGGRSHSQAGPQWEAFWVAWRLRLVFWRSGDQCRIPGCNQPTILFGSVCEGPSIAVAVGGRTEGCSGIDVASRPKSANLSLNRKTAGPPFVLAQLRVKAVHEDGCVTLQV